MLTGVRLRERSGRVRWIRSQFGFGGVDFGRKLLIGRIELERPLPIDLSLAHIVQRLVGITNVLENDRIFRFQSFEGPQQLGQRRGVMSGMLVMPTLSVDIFAIVGL